MFDSVRNNRRIVQIFLALITLPFAFFGVESYFNSRGAGEDVAKVGDSKVTQQEFQQALQAQQERLRGSVGRELPPSALDNPELRKAVAESLINQRLVAVHSQKARLMVPDQALAQFIASVPELQENGQFSKAKYEALVAQQGMSIEAFEQRLRQDMVTQQSVGAVNQAVLPGKTSSQRWLAAQLESRDVAEVQFKPEDYLTQVKLAADAAKTFYEANRKAFEVPEQVKAEFLVLNRQTIAAQTVVSDEEIKAWYNGHQDQYKQGDERRASHILIMVDKSAPEAAVTAAKAKIEEIQAQLKKSPSSFAALAKQNSQDPGSAKQGGDLGWFGKGAMVKPFEDAAFTLKEGAISDVVRSDFGFHLIQVTGVRGEKAKPLDEVKASIVAGLKEQNAQKKFAEASEAFSNTVYEQSDSLKPAAEKFHLTAQQTGLISKGSRDAGPLANPKLQEALFSEDAIKNHRNTEAVEVSPGVLISARVLEHKAAALRPLDEVKAEIEKHLKREEAAKLARKAGEEALLKVGKGDTSGFKWSASHNLPRLGAQGISPDALRAIFKADAAKLPAYAGAPLPDGSFALYRIEKVKAASTDGKEDEKAAFLRQQYSRIVAQEEMTAWLATLRQRYGVELNSKFLEVPKDH
ncbi:MAG TPA: SurA N-terminal domain-containing protein [Rhodocyclaceae bacterium]|jgi:peptidyl-prolyl cis-trans isomerase D